MKKFLALVASVAMSFSMFGANVSANGSPIAKPIDKVETVDVTPSEGVTVLEDAKQIDAVKTKKKEIIKLNDKKEVYAIYQADVEPVNGVKEAKITVDEKFNGLKATVFHLKKDGNWEHKVVDIKDGSLTVSFDSWSPVFVVITQDGKLNTQPKKEEPKDEETKNEETKKEETNTAPAPAEPERLVSPQTNDAAPFVSLMSTIAMLSAAGYVVVSKKDVK